jgi:hypothetical protein
LLGLGEQPPRRSRRTARSAVRRAAEINEARGSMSARSCSTKVVDKKRAKHLPPGPRRAGVVPASGSHWLSTVLGAAFRLTPSRQPPHRFDQSAAARRLSTAESFRDQRALEPFTWPAKRRKGSWPAGRGSGDQTNQLNQWRGDAIAGRTHSGRFVSRTSPANCAFS